MTGFRIAALVVAFGVLAILPIDPLSAAADKTLGMAVMSARVGANGNLAGGAGAESVVRAGPKGQYKITFARDLTAACVATATISGPGETGEQGFIVADITSGGFLLVRTYAANANFEDRSFYVIVFCNA